MSDNCPECGSEQWEEYRWKCGTYQDYEDELIVSDSCSRLTESERLRNHWQGKSAEHLASLERLQNFIGDLLGIDDIERRVPAVLEGRVKQRVRELEAENADLKSQLSGYDICFCSHTRAEHGGHCHIVGTPEPIHCSQCNCRAFDLMLPAKRPIIVFDFNEDAANAGEREE